VSDKNWEQVSRIFNTALEKEPSSRNAYLDEVCENNPSLRRELQDLLSASDEQDSFIDSNKAAVTGLTGEPKLKPGDKLGLFEVIRLLGIGGMGEVYLAKDLRLNRQVALKILPPNSLADPNATKRFLREAQAAASLEHTHICTIHEIGEENELSFIVMQFFEGETLAEKIKRSPLKPQEALRFALQIADALDEAHSHGIIHRDIKPANIIITPSNSAQVLDFGLAKKVLYDPADSESSLKTFLSQPGLIMGTVSYMSPEQVRGGEADMRSDLWSLGVVLYEMLTGRTPFTGANSVEKLAAVLYHEPDQQDVPPEIAGILKKALQKTPDDRYQTADEMITDLKRQKQEMDFEEQLKMHVSIAPGDKVLSEKMSQILSGQTGMEISSGRKKRPARIGLMIFTGILAVALVVGGWYLWKFWRVMQAGENLRRMEELAKEKKTLRLTIWPARWNRCCLAMKNWRRCCRRYPIRFRSPQNLPAQKFTSAGFHPMPAANFPSGNLSVKRRSVNCASPAGSMCCRLKKTASRFSSVRSPAPFRVSAGVLSRRRHWTCRSNYWKTKNFRREWSLSPAAITAW
jgi:serine/threonine protein kinase